MAASSSKQDQGKKSSAIGTNDSFGNQIMGLRAANANGNHQKRDRRVSSSVNPANILNAQAEHRDLKRKAIENKETITGKNQN